MSELEGASLVEEMGQPTANSEGRTPFAFKTMAGRQASTQQPVWLAMRDAGDKNYAEARFAAAAERYTDSLALMLGHKDRAARASLLVRRAAGVTCPSRMPSEAGGYHGMQLFLPVT